MQAIKCVVVGDGWDVEFILAELCLLLQCRGMQLLQERGWGLHGSFGVYGDVIEHSTSPVLVHEKQNESGVLCWNKADSSRAAHQHRYIKHPCQCSRVGGWVGEGRRGMGGGYFVLDMIMLIVIRFNTCDDDSQDDDGRKCARRMIFALLRCFVFRRNPDASGSALPLPSSHCACATASRMRSVAES